MVTHSRRSAVALTVLGLFVFWALVVGPTARARLPSPGMPESLPLSQLAARLSCVKSNITQLVDRLEADGLVSRAGDPADRRSRLATMTAAGRKACDEGLRVQRQAERELFGTLSAEETRQLAALMEKLERGAG